MKKPVYLVLFSLMLILMIAMPAYAGGGGYYRGGGYYHGGGGYYHGGGGYYRGGGYYHGSGHIVVGGGFWFGPGWGWGPGWWGSAGYPYPYYSYPPYVIQQQPSVYEMQTPQRDEEYYWYFCPDSKNYYPYVKQCPNGWLKVVPPQGPSQ